MRLKVMLISLAFLSCLAMQTSAQMSPSYGITDPAIKEMLISLDMPRGATIATASNVAGNWHLQLSNGPFIELSLLQSGAIAYGKASVNTGVNSQWATASGDISDNRLRLNVVPESGTELYAVSINLDRLPLTGTYVAFMGNTIPKSGTASASWRPA